MNTVTKVSPRSVTETVDHLKEILESKHVKLFFVIDQRAEARDVGLDLRETTLVGFGNPQMGTPVMDKAPMAALDLPLKVLVWNNKGKTNVTYYPPSELAERHHLEPELQANLSAIDALTDALVAT